MHVLTTTAAEGWLARVQQLQFRRQAIWDGIVVAGVTAPIAASGELAELVQTLLRDHCVALSGGANAAAAELG
jgi:hypothetical protein